MYIYKPENSLVPIKVWADEYSIEESALDQLDNCSKLPFIFHHLAAMADCHTGYGVTIGSILVTDGVIVPNAVGVDISCGVIAVRTSLLVSQLSEVVLKEIMGKIREVTPMGVGAIHQKEQDESLMPKQEPIGICSREYGHALKSLGSLGSNNHFIEFQKDSEDHIWIMIHSGSRNLGYKVAEYYNELAYDLNKKWHSNTLLPKNKKDSLAFLPIETQEAKDYMQEMQYCADFAFANRKLMVNRILEILRNILGTFENNYCSNISNGITMINIAHNYARWENHFGKNVIVHRKGAISARLGEIGIIPGDMGSKSYIVRGLGNPESFMSCSHGAGRKMSRGVAQRILNLEEEIKKLEDQGIIHGIRNEKDLDEAPGSYKRISEVMAQQSDLVEIVTELTPICNLKGN